MFSAGSLFLFAFMLLAGGPNEQPMYTPADTAMEILNSPLNSTPVDTLAASLVSFAQTLKGIPYRYATADPKKGFDCSGFVMYVFNHFEKKLPRSSIDFTNIGKEIDFKDARPGDLILFTGTNAAVRKVGHVGIITQTTDTLVFIHASSGKTPAVIETALNPHYKKRFIKVVRVL